MQPFQSVAVLQAMLGIAKAAKEDAEARQREAHEELTSAREVLAVADTEAVDRARLEQEEKVRRAACAAAEEAYEVASQELALAALAHEEREHELNVEIEAQTEAKQRARRELFVLGEQSREALAEAGSEAERLRSRQRASFLGQSVPDSVTQAALDGAKVAKEDAETRQREAQKELASTKAAMALAKTEMREAVDRARLEQEEKVRRAACAAAEEAYEVASQELALAALAHEEREHELNVEIEAQTEAKQRARRELFVLGEQSREALAEAGSEAERLRSRQRALFLGQSKLQEREHELSTQLETQTGAKERARRDMFLLTEQSREALAEAGEETGRLRSRHHLGRTLAVDHM